MDFPIDQISFWLLLIPGFVMVWSFRYFTDSKKTGDFEFVGLAIFWGLVHISFLGFLNKLGMAKLPSTETNNIGSLWGIGLAFCFYPFFIGLIGAQISKYDWFRRIIKKLKSKWFNGKSN